MDLSSFKVNDTAMISCPTRQVEKWKSQVYIHNNDADATYHIFVHKLHNLDYDRFSNYHQLGKYDGSRTDARKTANEYFTASGNGKCVVCYILHTWNLT